MTESRAFPPEPVPAALRLPRQLGTKAVLRLRPPQVLTGAVARGRVRAIGASVIGPSHEAAGTVRQDSFVIRLIGPFLLVIAADGLGSAQYSHAASWFACRWAGERIARAMRARSGPCKEVDAVLAVRRALLEVAHYLDRAEQRGAPGPMYTTILGAVCGPEYILTFNFGDGAVAAFNCSGGEYVQRSFLGPEHGDYSGEVYPLLPDEFDDHLRIALTPRAERVLVATDGVADFALTDDETDLKADFAVNFDQAMAKLRDIGAARELAGYLRGSQASSVNSDDKTLLWVEA